MTSFPALLRSAGSTVIRPLTLVEIFFRRSDAAGDIIPSDARHGDVSGGHPLRVLVIGETGMVSLGVLSHDLGLTGFCARELARLVHSGVHWSIREIPSAQLADARATIADSGHDLAEADVALLMIGISDVLSFTPVAAWRRDLEASLVAASARLPSHGIIAVAEIPPLENAGSLSRVARAVAGMRARLLNEHTRAIVARHPAAFTVAFPDELTHGLWVPRSIERHYRRTYTVWGGAIAAAVAPHLAPRTD